MQITSPKNSLLQEVRRAAHTGRPTPDGLVAAEGPHLLDEALRGRWTVEAILATAEATERHDALLKQAGVEVVQVSARAFESVAATESSQEIISLLRPASFEWSQVLRRGALILVLDGVQDPGNAGTLIRSAEAFGAAGVILTRGSVRVSNGKLLRATAGSIFRMPYLEAMDPDTVAEKCKGHLFTLAPLARRSILEADLTREAALVVGSEGGGASSVLLQRSTALRIPSAGVESLNAAIAGSIALFEAARQRSSG